MKSFDLCLRTESPLLLSEGPPSNNLIETLDFIPGNTIRGFMANRYLEQDGQPADDAFHRLFLSGDVRFGFARLNGCQVIPHSARTCKYNAGFLENAPDRDSHDKPHGVVDLLGGEKSKPCQCPICGKSVDYFEGFYDPITFTKHNVSKRLITRTAINPETGAAAATKLYSQQIIEEEQLFYAVIEVPDDVAETFKNLISKPFTARIGTGRSRGQGWVEVKEATYSKADWGTAKERYEQYNIKSGQPVLAVTFLSDAIFHDDFLRDRTAPDIFDLRTLGIDPEQWGPQPQKAFVTNRLVFGFDGVPLQLPRQPHLVVSAGSVLLYKAKEGITPYIPTGEGLGWIGDENREGFGQVLLWHPFHIVPDKQITL